MHRDKLNSLAMSWLDQASELRAEVRDAETYTEGWMSHLLSVRNARFLGRADALERMAREIGELADGDED